MLFLFRPVLQRQRFLRARSLPLGLFFYRKFLIGGGKFLVGGRRTIQGRNVNLKKIYGRGLR